MANTGTSAGTKAIKNSVLPPNTVGRPMIARLSKTKKVFHHRDTEGTEDTEFYFVNCACGVNNNTKFFSVPSVSVASIPRPGRTYDRVSASLE